MGEPRETDVAEEDILRARFYELIGALLAAPPAPELLGRLRDLEGDDTPLGQALSSLASLAAQTTVADAADEFHDLFIGVTRGELLPYGSYYQTGSLHARPLADLRDDLAALGLERQDGVAEPEDSMAFLCEVMRARIEGSFGPPACLGEQKQFFDRHLAPWAGQFFRDLEAAKSARLYGPVGTLGRIFFDIETQALALTVSGASNTNA